MSSSNGIVPKIATTAEMPFGSIGYTLALALLSGVSSTSFSCDGKAPNCLPIMHSWNYIVRLYRVGRETSDGMWKFAAPRVLFHLGTR